MTYSVTLLTEDQFKRTEEAIMPFELIMLMGFFGTALLGLLPATPARVADESFRGKHQKRSDREQRRIVRAGRVMRRDEASRRTQPWHATCALSLVSWESGGTIGLQPDDQQCLRTEVAL